MRKSFDCKMCERARETDGKCSILLTPPPGVDCPYFTPKDSLKADDNTLSSVISQRASDLYVEFSSAFPGLRMSDWLPSVKDVANRWMRGGRNHSNIRRARSVGEQNLRVRCEQCGEEVGLDAVSSTKEWRCPACHEKAPSIVS